MRTWTIALCLTIIVIVALWYCFNTYQEESYIKSDIDNRVYLIRRGRNKSEAFLKESANVLAIINQRIERLIEHLDKNFSNDDTKAFFIKKLKENYNPYMISEAAVDPRYTTFTVDKKDINICLRTRNHYEKIYDINLLMYVVIHELAHLCNYSRDGTPIIGHGREFKEIFAFLVSESIKLKLYEYEDYSKSPKEYCNIVINSSII
jgi:predicted metal-dependent hydrolase